MFFIFFSFSNRKFRERPKTSQEGDHPSGQEESHVK